MIDIDVFKLVESNLEDLHGRFMMIFTTTSIVDDALIKLIEKKTKETEKGLFEYLSGTSSIEDQLSLISKIPIMMKHGYTLILHRLDFLYPSLYEVFNQAYKDITKSSSRYCNIQIAGTKQLCKVGEGFKVIILQSQEEGIFEKPNETIEKDFPAPLLNRFEKHVILKSQIMSDNDIQSKNMLQDYISEPFRSSKDQNTLMLESVMANYSDETLWSVPLSRKGKMDVWEEAIKKSRNLDRPKHGTTEHGSDFA